jgi:hypothetical protein
VRLSELSDAQRREILDSEPDAMRRMEMEISMRRDLAREANSDIMARHPGVARELKSTISRAWSEIDMGERGIGSPVTDAAVASILRLLERGLLCSACCSVGAGI